MILTADEALRISKSVKDIDVELKRIDQNIRDQALIGEMYTSFLVQSHRTALQIAVALKELGYSVIISNNSTHSCLDISWDGLKN